MSTGQIRTSVDESDTEQNKMKMKNWIAHFVLGASDAVTRDLCAYFIVARNV